MESDKTKTNTGRIQTRELHLCRRAVWPWGRRAQEDFCEALATAWGPLVRVWKPEQRLTETLDNLQNLQNAEFGGNSGSSMKAGTSHPVWDVLYVWRLYCLSLVGAECVQSVLHRLGFIVLEQLSALYRQSGTASVRLCRWDGESWSRWGGYREINAETIRVINTLLHIMCLQLICCNYLIIKMGLMLVLYDPGCVPLLSRHPWVWHTSCPGNRSKMHHLDNVWFHFIIII